MPFIELTRARKVLLAGVSFALAAVPLFLLFTVFRAELFSQRITL